MTRERVRLAEVPSLHFEITRDVPARFDEAAADAMRSLGGSLLPAAWLLLEFDPADYRLLRAGEAAEATARAVFERGVLQPLAVSFAALRSSLRPEARAYPSSPEMTRDDPR